MNAVAEPECFIHEHWHIRQDRIDGAFHVYTPTYRYHGAGLTRKAAIEMVDEASGADYRRLPPINRNELRVVEGHKTKSEGHRRGWFRLTHYYLGETHLGKVQERFDGRYEYTTVHDASASCVIGINLRWLLKTCGYRLIED